MTDPFGGLPAQPEEEPAPQPAPPQKRPPRPTTWAILLSLFAGFAAEAIVGHDPAAKGAVVLMQLGALFPPAVVDGDWWRVGSYAFLHVGWAHILMNCYALWVLAPQLEATFGSNLTLGLFAATAIAGGAASLAWNLHFGHAALAAGASGGIFGLFGATIALYLRVRHTLPEHVRRGIVRAVAVNLLINVAIAFTAPVDNAAHAGGLLAGLLLALVSPLGRDARKPWQTATRYLLIAAALALAAMEGAAVARAVKPKTRILRGPGVEAQVPGILVPMEPGIAAVPGAAIAKIERAADPLSLTPGQDAVRIGDRTWVRERVSSEGWDETHLIAADGTGTVVLEFACRDPFCRGAAGDSILEQMARTVKSIH